MSEKEWQTGSPDLHPANVPAPRPQREPAPIDPEQVRQFQQFQQFQELMRQQGGVPLLPTTARKPLWKKVLGSKLVRKLAMLLIVALGLYFAYQHYFGTNDNSLPASETGGHTFTDRKMLQTEPNQSVRMVYQRIADGTPEVACGQFTSEAARQFANGFGAADCDEAVTALKVQVTGTKDAYANPVFPPELRNPPLDATVVEISSCRLAVTGGPRLGWFKVEKTPHLGQWIITEHRLESCDQIR